MFVGSKITVHFTDMTSALTKRAYSGLRLQKMTAMVIVITQPSKSIQTLRYGVNIGQFKKISKSFIQDAFNLFSVSRFVNRIHFNTRLD